MLACVDLCPRMTCGVIVMYAPKYILPKGECTTGMYDGMNDQHTTETMAQSCLHDCDTTEMMAWSRMDDKYTTETMVPSCMNCQHATETMVHAGMYERF